MAAPQLPSMTLDHEAFCLGDYKAITTHLKGLQNTRGGGYGSMKVAQFVTAFPTSTRKTQAIASASDADVSPPPLPTHVQPL